MHASIFIAALLASTASALPVNGAFGHYDSLAHHVRAQPTTHIEQSLFSRLFKRAMPMIRPAGIGRTLTHLERGQPIYDESIIARRDVKNLKKRQPLPHPAMAEPGTASVEQITQIANLGPGPVKIAATGSSESSLEDAPLTDYPTITTTMTLVPTTTTVYERSGSASTVTPTPIATRVVYVTESNAFVPATQIKLASSMIQQGFPQVSMLSYAPAQGGY